MCVVYNPHYGEEEVEDALFQFASSHRVRAHFRMASFTYGYKSYLTCIDERIPHMRTMLSDLYMYVYCAASDVFIFIRARQLHFYFYHLLYIKVLHIISIYCI